MAKSRRGIIIAVAATFILAGAGQAQETNPPDQNFASMTLAELIPFANAYVADPPNQRACTTGVPLFEAMLRHRPEEAMITNHLLQARVNCAQSENDFATAVSIFGENESLRRSFDPLFVLYLARMANSPDAIISELRYFLVTSQVMPVSLSEFQRGLLAEAVRYSREQGRESEVEAIAAEAFRANRFAFFEASFRSGMAMTALPSIMRDSPGDLPGLLEEMTGVTTLGSLLIRREYESIWPLIEQRVGPGFAHATQDAVNLAEAQFGRSPSTTSLNAYSQALAANGQHQKAVDVVTQWRVDHAEAGIDQQLAWAINQAAFSLDALGRYDEADVLMEELASLDPVANPWLVNFVINRTGRFAMQERWAEVVSSSDLAGRWADEQGSAYAKLLVARDRACALEALGRADEAREALATAEYNGTVDPTVLASALMCLDRHTEAEDLILAGLQDEGRRISILLELQDERLSVPYVRSALPHARELLETSSAIRAALMTHARLVPQEYLPNTAASVSRR